MNQYQWWICTGLSGFALFLSSWTVIPAPTISLLQLGVGAPEVSPLLLFGNICVLLIVLPIARKRRRPYRIPIACSIAALLFSSVPVLQLPGTIHQAEANMQQTLGTDYQTKFDAPIITSMRSHPLILSDVLTGFKIPAVRRDRRSFLTADNTSLELELYRSTATGEHPAIITIYGGAWQRGEPSQHTTFNAYMAAQGYTVVAIAYRHAPQYRFPTQLQDVQAAVRWVSSHAADYNIDINRIALMGWSAGAHLALLAAYQADAIPVRAVVGYYGPTNLTGGYEDPPFPDPLHIRAVLETFLGGPPAQVSQRYILASPVHYVRPGLPPTLLIHGNRDHIVKSIFSQELYDRLRTTQNTAILISLPWAEHAFDAVFHGIGNQIALYHTERFLAWALQQKD
jgi:acetyl esterase/lipase